MINTNALNSIPLLSISFSSLEWTHNKTITKLMTPIEFDLTLLSFPDLSFLVSTRSATTHLSYNLISCFFPLVCPFSDFFYHFPVVFFFFFSSLHYISFHFISFCFVSFHFISFHFLSFHYISFHFISFHFISLQTFSFFGLKKKKICKLK